MQLRRTHLAPTTPAKYRSSQLLPQPKPQNLLPSTKQLAWLLVQNPKQITDDDRLLLQHRQQNDELQDVYGLVQQFVDMVKQQAVEQFDTWLDSATNAVAVQLVNFAHGIKQDYDAVRAALETPWSNGQTEGQVNRLKFIKRQMFGRAHFDLLRLRVIHPP